MKALDQPVSVIDEIQSANWAPPEPGTALSVTGSRFDLANGSLITPNFAIDGETGDLVAAKGTFTIDGDTGDVSMGGGTFSVDGDTGDVSMGGGKLTYADGDLNVQGDITADRFTIVDPEGFLAARFGVVGNARRLNLYRIVTVNGVKSAATFGYISWGEGDDPAIRLVQGENSVSIVSNPESGKAVIIASGGESMAVNKNTGWHVSAAEGEIRVNKGVDVVVGNAGDYGIHLQPFQPLETGVKPAVHWSTFDNNFTAIERGSIGPGASESATAPMVAEAHDDDWILQALSGRVKLRSWRIPQVRDKENNIIGIAGGAYGLVGTLGSNVNFTAGGTATSDTKLTLSNVRPETLALVTVTADIAAPGTGWGAVTVELTVDGVAQPDTIVVTEPTIGSNGRATYTKTWLLTLKEAESTAIRPVFKKSAGGGTVTARNTHTTIKALVLG